ncbi:MAG: tRNA pseudouridine(55) synthase TruB [Clostridia bacterium]|nr:tRNA pseudouridine(55) synthase TruB [Clostridia bacterium]
MKWWTWLSRRPASGSMAESHKHGILLVDKPRGLTSFGVVSRLRRLIGEKKIGHTGTLDPFAEGLLAICVGKATAAVQFMDTYDKTYHVRVLFGAATDTMDLTGTVTNSYPFATGELSRLKAAGFTPIRQAVHELPGEKLQIPPMYSAVKVDGQPLYALARAGQTIERQSRPIVIRQATLDAIECLDETEVGGPRLSCDLTLEVSKGTYIRVIADELGQQLGWYAHAKRLVRTTVGPFVLGQAVTLDELESRFEALAQSLRKDQGLDPADRSVRRQIQDQLWQELSASGQIHDLTEALSGFPVLKLPGDLVKKIVQGQKLYLDEDQVLAQMTPEVKPQAGLRLAIHGPAGLAGMCHLELVTDRTSETFRIVTERIFIHHEHLLSE